MFKKGDKIRCIKKSDYYSYEFKLGDVCSVLRYEPGMKDMKVLTLDGNEIWNEVENFELVKEETMFEVGGKIRCVDATYSDERLTVGKIYTLLGYCPKAKEATFEVECDQGYKSWWKEGRFVETFEVGDRVGWEDSFYGKESGYIDEINTKGEIWVNWDNRSRTWGTEEYWTEQGLKVIKEETMFEIGDEIKIIDIHPRDGYYNRKELIGKRGIIINSSYNQNYPGYFTGEISIDELNLRTFFFAVKIEKIKEATMFETGERIRCTSSSSHPEWLKEGKVYVVCGHNNSGNPLVLGEDGSRIDIAYGTFVKEVPMSKYQELKERIENVKGWDKDADDILREMKFFGKSFYIAVCTDTSLDVLNCDKYSLVNFRWSTQCEKLEAFKKALLYLLDHSDIKKDEKEEKIKELVRKIELKEKVVRHYADEVHSLESQIEELRR